LPLPLTKIRNGFTYGTATGQVRMVLKIAGDKVYYMARGKRAGSWHIAHNLNNPPSLDTFASDVERRIVPTPQDAIAAAKRMRKMITQLQKVARVGELRISSNSHVLSKANTRIDFSRTS